MAFKIKHANKNVVLLKTQLQVITNIEIQALLLCYMFGDVSCRLLSKDSKTLWAVMTHDENKF
jgi:hypothetical protein